MTKDEDSHIYIYQKKYIQHLESLIYQMSNKKQQAEIRNDSYEESLGVSNLFQRKLRASFSTIYQLTRQLDIRKPFEITTLHTESLGPLPHVLMPNKANIYLEENHFNRSVTVTWKTKSGQLGCSMHLANEKELSMDMLGHLLEYFFMQVINVNTKNICGKMGND